MQLQWTPSTTEESPSLLFCGLPLAVKDTIDVQGYRTTAATPGLARKASLP